MPYRVRVKSELLNSDGWPDTSKKPVTTTYVRSTLESVIILLGDLQRCNDDPDTLCRKTLIWVREADRGSSN